MKKILSFAIVIFSLFTISFALDGISNSFVGRVEAATFKQVRAMHILVPTESEAQQIRAEIVSAQSQNELFTNFRNAAKKYSKCPSGANGGDLGWFGKSDMVLPFELAAFDLTPGDVSQPVKTQFGYHLIYVINRK